MKTSAATPTTPHEQELMVMELTKLREQCSRFSATLEAIVKVRCPKDAPNPWQFSACERKRLAQEALTLFEPPVQVKVKRKF